MHAMHAMHHSPAPPSAPTPHAFQMAYQGRVVSTPTLRHFPHDHGAALPGVAFTMSIGPYGTAQVEVPFPEGQEAAAQAFAATLHVGSPFVARVCITDVQLCLHNVHLAHCTSSAEPDLFSPPTPTLPQPQQGLAL